MGTTQRAVERLSPQSSLASPPPVATAPLASISASVDVVHLHRIGNCRGRLDVTRDGVAFVPKEGGEEAFTLKYEEFLHALVDDTLTLKSAAKTYRFKAGTSRNEIQLRGLVDRIARARR